MLSARSGSAAGHGRARGAVGHSGHVRAASRAVDRFAAPDIVRHKGGESVVVGQGVVWVRILVARGGARQEPPDATGKKVAGRAGIAGGKAQGGGVKVRRLVHKSTQGAPRTLPLQ